MIALAALCAAQEIIEIGSFDYTDYIGTDAPIIVKFINPTCPHCFAMSDEFWQASEAFETVKFGSIDCVDHKALCVNTFNIEKYPTVALFKPQSYEPIVFNGGLTADDFITFIEDTLNIKGKREPKILFEVTPTNIDHWRSDYKCTFNIYYSSLFPHHKRFLYETRLAANIYLPEPNVSIGIIRCDKYRKLCLNVSDTGYPVGSFVFDGTYKAFTDMAIANMIVSNINENCGTHRDINGLLDDEQGLVPEAQPIVNRWNKGEDPHEALIEEMKKVAGADFYVKMMQRVEKDGVEKCRIVLDKMMSTMMRRATSMANIDAMKKRYNIFKLFVPDKPEERNTPEPTSSPVENDL